MKKYLKYLILILVLFSLASCEEKKNNGENIVPPIDDNGGGDNTGGDNTGGDNTGGDNTGGDNTGGDNTGGDNTGGDNTGGDNTGGDNTGGDNTGGDNTGGDNTGGEGNNAEVTTPGNTGNTGEVVKNGKVNIKKAVGSYESSYIEWESIVSSSKVNVYYKLTSDGDSSYKLVDKELIRGNRVDLLGLKSNTEYDIQITPFYGSDEVILDSTVVRVKTINYDRSGYAHYKYNDGVGAYNDDGTLKDNALIIYVDNENKNTISVEGSNTLKPGIGYFLNNNMYGSPNTETAKDADKDNNPLTNWYDTGITKITIDRPVVIRFIGKVESPEGATVYDSTQNGGSIGDNGHMVRMKNAKNLTIEGVGNDAVIYGWGIHFMRGTPTNGVDGGYSFEVRNLTFDKYPEDALGMEGIQDGSKLTAPVSRCWVHDVTFLPGFANPTAESDKSEGDGSCDFKRGEYFTLSYSKFIGAHKTNLVGSSDSSLQYNITMHHNYWQNCGSRVPLSRQANIHMYNNYFEITDDNQNEISYGQNTRANAYIYSENNYFQAVKNPSRVDGGAIKSYGDVKYSCFEKDGAVVVNSRDVKVNSGNKYENFDTNPSVFYYQDTTKKTLVERLTNAEMAKAECISLSGAVKNEVDYDNSKIYANQSETLNDSLNVTTPIKISKGVPYKIFTITTEATLTMTSTASVNAVVVDINGRMILNGSGTVDLEAGTYVIESAISRGASKGKSNAKEATIGNLSIVFDGGTAKQARIDNANKAISDIPSTIQYTNEIKLLINNARNLYNNLKADEKELVDNTRLNNAINEYTRLGQLYVEGLINNIGTVGQNSGDKINDAREAYNSLFDFNSQAVVSNYQTLVDAEIAFEQYLVDYIIQIINELGDITLNSKTAIEKVDLLINGLDDSSIKLITNINVLISAKDTYNNLVTVSELITTIDSIGEVTTEKGSIILGAKNTYDSLDAKYKAMVTNYNILEEKYDEYVLLASKLVTYNFDDLGTKGNETFSFISANIKPNISYTYNGITYSNALKIESSTIINVNVVTSSTITLVLTGASKKIKINGAVYTSDSNGIVKANVNAGSIQITKGDTTELVFIELAPAS